MTFDASFLGTGWSFPPTFERASGTVQMSSGVADIERSLSILFTTTIGERIMNPTYGCSLDEALFESMNSSRITYIQNLIETAILYHEPRIDADQVDVRPESVEGILWIHVGYTVRGTNSRFNFVYPYYLLGAEA